MFLKSLSLLLLLALATSAEYVQPTPFGVAESSHCALTYTVTYRDQWGPLITENRYSCKFPKTSSTPSSGSSSEQFRIPAPYDHPAGDHGSDERVVQTGAMTSDEKLFTQMMQSSLSKHSIIDYGCSTLEDSRLLSRYKYSNLFWGLQQLTNQSCIEPGEALEYIDVRRDWTADWRFTNVNRGNKRMCDWYGELANIAKALHYFCFHTLGRQTEDEFAGGEEIVAFGKDKEREQRWCMRYSKKGWNSAKFEEKCLGL